MSYEPVTVREAAQLEVLLFVALAFLGSLGVIYWGLQTYRFGRIIRDTPPEPVRSVAMGRTEVKGEVVPSERIFDRPFTDGRCVYGEYKVREYKEYPNDDDKDDQWKTVETGTFGTSFYIDDGSGQILVEPTDETLYEISDDHQTKIRVGKSENPPPPVQEFLSAGDRDSVDSTSSSEDTGRLGGLLNGLKSRVSGSDDETDDLEMGDESTDMDWKGTDDEDGSGSYEHVRRNEIGSSTPTGRKRRYIQKVLPAEQEIYVFGGAARRNPGEAGVNDVAEVIRTDPSTEEFIISDASEFELAKKYSRRSVVYVVSGLIASAMILALLAQILVTGPVYGIEAALPWVGVW